MNNVVPIRPGSGAGVMPELGREIPGVDLRYAYRSQYNEISFSRLTAILDAADRGYTEEWANLAVRMLRTDSHLASVYESRLVPVAGARWELEPGLGDPRLAQQAADDCRSMLEGLSDLERFFYWGLHGIGVGYSVQEIEWATRRGMVVPTKIHQLDADRFRFTERLELFFYDYGRAWGLADAESRIASNGAQGMKLIPDKYVIHIPKVVPARAPSSGLLMTVCRQWWVKQWVMKYWLGGAEVAGRGRFVGTYPQAADEATKQQLKTALESLSADGVITKSEDVQIEMLQPVADGASSVWAELLKTMNAEESKGMMGSTLNVEIGDTGGNRAAAESQFDATTLPRAERDGRAWWSTVERDLITPFLKFNVDRYGGRMPPIPRGKFVLYEEPVQIDQLAVDAQVVTNDELRSSRGLQPWGAERGGDKPAKSASVQVPGGFDPLAPAAPSAPELPDIAEGAPVEKAADAALNGAQVESLISIVEKVAAGIIPRETGISLITAAFPLSRQQAEGIMGNVGAGFVPASPDAAPSPAVPAADVLPPGGAVSAVPFRDRPWATAMRMALSSVASPMSTRSPSPTASPQSDASEGPPSSRSKRSKPTAQLGLSFK